MKRLIKLLGMTQEELTKRYTFKEADGALLIKAKKEGLRPLLTAHLDTINSYYNENIHPIEKDLLIKNNVISIKPEVDLACLGGDDRCGIWLIEKLLNLNEYDFLITTDEETGGDGVKYWVVNNIQEINKYKAFWSCIISLDRRSPNGVNEIADYGYGNEKLYELLKQDNFNIGMGSYTDGVDIAEETGIAMFNMSIGYDHEHSKDEVIYFNALQQTLKYLKASCNIKKFSCKQYLNNCNLNKDYGWSNDWNELYNVPTFTNIDNVFKATVCEICGEHKPLYKVYDSNICKECLKNMDI